MLGLPFELGMALRYLRPRRTPVSIITLLCILGVMLGVAILIIVIAVMTGFGEMLREKILGVNGHLHVRASQGLMADWRDLQTDLAREKGVKNVSAVVEGPVLVATAGGNGKASLVAGGLVRGIDSISLARMETLRSNIVSGRLDLQDIGVVLGDKLADDLQSWTGDSIHVASVQDVLQMQEASGGRGTLLPPESFEVRGVVHVGHEQIDASLILTSLANAQSFFGLEDRVHELVVTLDNSEELNTERFRRAFETRLGSKYQVISWMRMHSSIFEAIAMEKTMMYALLFFITIVAAFCIICAQLAFVMQKTREIGVLKALGATTGQVGRIFLVQSAVVGAAGVALGVLLGWLVVVNMDRILGWMRKLSGMDVFPKSIYFFDTIPAKMVTHDVVLICSVSLLMGLLAGVVPALIAARMHPVEAMRHA